MKSIGYAEETADAAPSLDGDIRTALAAISDLTSAVADMRSRVCGSYPVAGALEKDAPPNGWARDIGKMLSGATQASQEAISDIRRIRETLGL